MEPSSARNAVLFDPHPLWVDALEPVLRGIGVEVVGTATTRDRALALVADKQPDLFVAEISCREGIAAGLASLRQARERSSRSKVIVLSSSASTHDIDGAFAAGATAYIVKTAHPEDIASTIRQTFGSSVFFAQPTPTRAPEAQSKPALAAVAPPASPGLTRRETEILRLVGEGHSNGQLARMLWVTEQTVKFHLSNIYRKLDVRNRTEASRWAQLHGLLPSENELRRSNGGPALSVA
jgi:DNA-binding NarL/FixJ family response regulator